MNSHFGVQCRFKDGLGDQLQQAGFARDVGGCLIAGNPLFNEFLTRQRGAKEAKVIVLLRGVRDYLIN